MGSMATFRRSYGWRCLCCIYVLPALVPDVVDSWIRPSLFQVQLARGQQQPYDEWTLSEFLGRDRVDTFMAAHYDSWITKADLQTAFNAGINSVRIPLGYWAVDMRPELEPYASSEAVWPFVSRALDWCKDIGLRVQIDLHALPGSQNGLDHSGRRGAIRWPDAPYYNRSLSVVRLLMQRLADEGHLAPIGPVDMIQPANEPWMTIDMNVVLRFYNQTYSIIRAIAPAEHVAISFSDSFRLPDPAFAHFMPASQGFQNVYLDEHYYQIFDYGGLSMSREQHLASTTSFFRAMMSNHVKQSRLIVGEFTLATTDCAHWLSGVNMGNRWDGTRTGEGHHDAFGTCTGDDGNDPSQFSDAYRAWLRSYAQALFQLFENTLNLTNPETNEDNWSAGYYFWTLKTEGAPQWDLLAGLKGGWIPVPVNAYDAQGKPSDPQTGSSTGVGDGGDDSGDGTSSTGSGGDGTDGSVTGDMVPSSSQSSAPLNIACILFSLFFCTFLLSTFA
jgi:glucan 1,3-beta-glucosidase